MVEKGLSGCGGHRPSGSFDCADHDKTVICFAQDDVEFTMTWNIGGSFLGIHLFVGGDELPAPGFGEVFEVGVLGAD